jgi:probable HAF family extracellular repeat protein
MLQIMQQVSRRFSFRVVGQRFFTIQKSLREEKMNISLSVVRLCAAGILLAGAGHAKASLYTFLDLGELPFESTAAAYSINNSEQITGFITTSTSNGSSAVRWDGVTPTILSSPYGGKNGYANAINNSGHVAGWSSTAVHQSHATVWNGSSQTILSGLPGGADSEALGINDSGLAVGWAKNSQGYDQATLWKDGSAVQLQNLNKGQESEAAAINNSGQIAGYSDINGKEAYLATKWVNGQVEKLGTLGGSISRAYDINDVGQVVGYARTANGTDHATLWNGTTATDLGTLGGELSSAWAINNAGQVVGWAEDGNYSSTYLTRATLWNGTSAVDLNSYLDQSSVEAGWYLVDARGINDRGSIAGVAINFYSGTQNAFLLSTVSPVPEPETYMMLLIGLSVVGFMIWRKREKSAVGTGALMAI